MTERLQTENYRSKMLYLQGMDTQGLVEALERTFPGSKIEVTDMTGGGDHFQVLVVSRAFEGLGLVERHQLVYGALKVASNDAIHALALKTLTPEQWEKARNAGPATGRLPLR